MGQQNRPSLTEIRAEMARLTAVLMKKNEEYILREAKLTAWHTEQIGLGNNPGHLTSVLKNDLKLADIAGAAKTCAALAGGLAQVLSAELAWRAYHEERGLALQQGRQQSPPTAHSRPTTVADAPTEVIRPRWDAPTEVLPVVGPWGGDRVPQTAPVSAHKQAVRRDLQNRFPHLIPEAERLGMI